VAIDRQTRRATDLVRKQANENQMEPQSVSPSALSMVRRIVVWNLTIISFTSIILAITAAQNGEYTGAGVCLLAAVAAPAMLGRIILRP